MSRLTRTARIWIRAQHGAAITEFAILFPILLTMMMGAFDLGRVLTINQKVISASQIIGDLITRNQLVTLDNLDDIILAGEMALDPYDRAPFGYDIVSLEYESGGTPVELWRLTENMPQNDDVFERAIGLGETGEGVIAVSVSYIYRPFFTGILTDDIEMQEVAFLRGRRTAIVECEDC